MRIARVIVDINHADVDRVFDYAASEDIDVGQRVLVPFGKGNRPMDGCVLEMTDGTDVPSDKIKSVLRRQNSYAAVSKDLIELARRIAAR